MKNKLYDLFLKPTENGFLQFFRYIFVGGTCFAVDWVALWLLEAAGLHYLIAGILSFILGLITNYVLSKLFVFKDNSINRALEFTIYAVIGVVGLGLTELFMALLTEYAGIHFLISKFIAAAVVTFWNYFGRKAIYAVAKRIKK